MNARTKAVRDVLLEASVIEDDRSWEFTCDHIAREITRGASADDVAYLLDAHHLAVEHDPETQALAARLVERVGEVSG